MRVFQPLLIIFSIALLIVTAIGAGPVSQDTNSQDFTPTRSQVYQITNEFQADLSSPEEGLHAHDGFLAFTAPITDFLLEDKRDF